jgi:nucleotide-binding universal stress UspA family protein
MRRILVPVDGSAWSDRALRPAVSMAERLGAQVVVMMAHEANDEPSAMDPDRVEPFADQVEISSRAVIGPAADAVLAVAAEVPETLICMATHGRSEVGRLVLGSVAESVVQRAECPVMLIGERCHTWPLARERFRVVVCTDETDQSEAILPIVRRLESAGARIWLIEVVMPDENVFTGPPRPSREVLRALGRLEELRGRLAGDTAGEFEAAIAGRIEIRALHGADVARAVELFTEDIHGSLIALATHGRAGLARVAPGSLAMSIVRRATCPVLLVRSGN